MESKVVIITGAASGIGMACARRFAEDGACVVIADINEAAGEKAARDLSEEKYQAIFVHCDVSQRFDVRNLVAKTVDAFGRIDVLINNAAVLDTAPFLELREEEFERVLDVNLKGYFLTGQAVARQMVAQAAAQQAGEEDRRSGAGRQAAGTIINMSSVNAIFALPDHITYSVSKGGIAQLTRAMALALAPNNIRVNAIGPGSILTPLLEQVAEDEQARAMLLSRTPMARLGKPEEIAAIAVFLASDESSYITGQTIYADGGRLPLNYTVKVK